MAKYTLDERFVKSRKPGSSTRIYFDNHKDAPKGFGLRVTPAGSKAWILNYYPKTCSSHEDKHGREHRITLEYGYPTWGPKKARTEASKLKTAIIAGADPVCDARNVKAEKEAAAEQKLARSKYTLGGLLEAYADQLKRKGKASARAVENCLRKNVERAFPDLWKTPADEIDLDDCVEIVAALADDDKLREAAKLRSYLRAAYTAAIKARGDASAGELRKFKITANPAAMLATIDGNAKARKRVLSLKELRAYWKRITGLSDPDGAVLRFHLLSGGQRLEQLFRLQTSDRDGDDVTLLDPKGRRSEPRVHVVPLLPEAKKALDAIGKGPNLVSFDRGKSPATDAQFRARVKAVCDAMLNDEEIEEPFTPGDIRRTVETRLAAAKVPSDHLKHLLSHGFGGVQDRHYQRYEFHAEKLAALVTLRELVAPSGKVIELKQKASA